MSDQPFEENDPIPSEENAQPVLSPVGYQALFESHALPLLVYEVETGRFLAANRAAVRQYGYSNGEFAALTIDDIRPPSDLDELRTFLERHASAPVRRRDTRHVGKNGASFPVTVTSARSRFGKINARIITVQPRTEHFHTPAWQRDRTMRLLFEHSFESISLLSAEGTVLYVSPSSSRILGHSEKDLVNRNGFELVHPDDVERARQNMETALKSPDGAVTDELRIRTAEGSYRWMEVTATNMTHDPSVRAIVLHLRDVSDRKTIEGALRASEEQLQTIAESVTDWIWTVDSDGVLTYSNSAVTTILGYEVEEIVGTSSFELFFQDKRFSASASFRQFLSKRSGWTRLMRRMRHKDGSERFVESSAIVILDANGRIAGVRGVDRDVTERKAFERRIRYQAYHDVLTDLPNRILFHDRLSIAVAHARRRQQGVAVLLVDIDHLKVINDTLGHTAGDRLLKIIARRLRSATREEDSVARVGGDEFNILLTNVACADDATGIARKIREVLVQPMEIGGQVIDITASIGIALFPMDGHDAEELMRNAESAVVRAKELGRDTIQLFAPVMNEQFAQRIALESGLRRALDRNEFVVHYQPLYDRAEWRIAGVEALVRWNHPARGLLGPDEFIEIAEQTGLILPIGNWVLRKACHDLQKWRLEGIGDIRVAVNLSGKQIQQGDLVEIVRNALEESALPAHLLELEITETVAMQNAALTLQTLRSLKEMGISIAVDDFGTGYSSLVYLTKFPIDTVKVDRAFVRDVTTDSSDAAVVAAVVALAHSLNLKTVAEGVETREQLEFLTQHRCVELQGFLFSRPVPAAEIPRLVREPARR